MPADPPIKLFLALSDEGRQFANYASLAKVALHTALRNTRLAPHVLYDGSANEFTEWLTARGIRVIHARTTLYPEIKKRAERAGRKAMVGVGAGAFLRTDIPAIARQHGIEDRYVLYTDVDVMFLAEPSEQLRGLQPKYFAVAPEIRKRMYFRMNSGVMWMNLDGLNEERIGLQAVAARRLSAGAPGWDQNAFREHFGNRWTRRHAWDHLPLEMNWKPYWGHSDEAKIVHFHGPKPTDRDRLASGKAPKVISDLARGAYEEYCRVWDAALAEAG